MSVSKAYLRRLTRVVKDRETLAAIRQFLIKHDEEINTNNLVITFTGEMYYQGSIGKFTFYKMWDEYQWRKKSSLTGKRFRKDKAFKGSRESAERFALGNKLASKVYKMVDEEKKAYTFFCSLKKRAIGLIKEGKTVEEAKEVLVAYLRSLKMLKEERSAKKEARYVIDTPVLKAIEIETIESQNIDLPGAKILARHEGDISALRIVDTRVFHRPKSLRRWSRPGGLVLIDPIIATGPNKPAEKRGLFSILKE